MTLLTGCHGKPFLLCKSLAQTSHDTPSALRKISAEPHGGPAPKAGHLQQGILAIPCWCSSLLNPSADAVLDAEGVGAVRHVGDVMAWRQHT